MPLIRDRRHLRGRDLLPALCGGYRSEEGVATRGGGDDNRGVQAFLLRPAGRGVFPVADGLDPSKGVVRFDALQRLGGLGLGRGRSRRVRRTSLPNRWVRV